MKVLGIETSCDETAVAIYDSDKGILADYLHSQIALHAEYGGVVPELASRDHIRFTLPLVQKALKKAQMSGKELDGVAYTQGPGLAGALLVGACVGRSLAWGWNIPAIGVHHMEAHLLAPMLEPNPPSFPFLALLVSGGHTLLVNVKEVGQYQILGESLDDAAGEAFDKTAQLLGLPYPGGPAIEKFAQKGNPHRFHFPRPMLDQAGLDFSFSGLKTSVMQTFRQLQNPDDAQTRADIASAFQEAVVDTLFTKCKRALDQTALNRLVVAGGVGANKALRNQLNQLTDHGIEVFYPRFEYCTDNAAMVAYTGYQRLIRGEHDDLAIAVKPRWSLEGL